MLLRAFVKNGARSGLGATRRASCCGYDLTEGNEYAFEVRPSHFKFGAGIRHELGHELKDAGMRRIVVFTDKRVAAYVIFFFFFLKKTTYPLSPPSPRCIFYTHAARSGLTRRYLR
jgi:hypothetical protein